MSIILKSFTVLVASLIFVVALGFGKPASVSAEPFIAQITMFGGNFAPRNWALCDGQLLSIASNSALFSILGTTYGGDGRTTFGLPDLRGRVALHPGHGPGLTSRRLGGRGGTENETLGITQIPGHTHGLRASDMAGNSSDPTGRVNAVKGRTDIYTDVAPNVSMNASAITPTGGGQSHNNMQPWLGINHIIALVGVFPSRN